MVIYIAKSIQILWNKNNPMDPHFPNYIYNVLKPISHKITLSVIYCALKYINKISDITRNKTPYSEYKVFIIAMHLADIQLNDKPYTLSTWSKLSGICIDNIKLMRKDFLILLDYNINISNEEYKLWTSNSSTTISSK